MKKLLAAILLLPSLAIAQPAMPSVNINDASRGTQTNDVKVTLDSEVIALPSGAATSANQSTEITSLQLIDNIVSGSGVNVSQINGVAPTMGNGVSGTGVQRVTIASDSTGQLTCNAGTNLNTSALATSANQSTQITSLQLIDNIVSGSGVNVSQINGVAPSMGNGVSGTGVQRVTLASDSTGQLTCNAGTNLNTSALALNTSVDGVEGLLTTIDADTGAIATSVAAIDADTTTIIGHVDGIESDLASIDSFLNSIEQATGLAGSLGDNSQNVTTAGTRVQLSSVACQKVIITAKAANTGTIWVGGSTVAAGRGVPLVALQSVTLDVSNTNAVYIDSTVNGEGITYAYLIY